MTGRSRFESRPKLQKRYVLVIGVVVLVCAATGIAQICHQLAGRPRGLDPPDPEVPLPPSPSIERRFTRAAVCSDAMACSAVGRDILARNGSVVDAAIATMFCNGIITSQSMGIGGGFLMTLYRRDAREAVVLNARETAPAAATTNMFGDERLLAQNGGLAIGVPGEIRGYWEAHKKYGVLPWKELVAPAIKICEEGYNMTEHQYTSLLFREQSIHNSSILRDMFVDPQTHKLLKRGSHIRPGKICSTLRVLAEEGGDVFYNGSIARMLAQDIEDWGGLITEQDFRDYKVEWQEPVSVTMRDGNRLFSVPPPGSGAVIAFILNILEGYNLTAESVSTIDDTVLTFHRTTEAFKYGYARRTELGDPNFVNVTETMKRLVSKSYARTIRRKIRDDRTNSNASVYGGVFYNQNDHGTSHISIVAPNGDAVSITSTVNLYFTDANLIVGSVEMSLEVLQAPALPLRFSFGSGVASEQTGVILNSGMDDFSSPNFNSFFGVPGSPANCIEPGKRSLSSMSPSIVVDSDGDVRMVLGASGGTRITTAVAFVIMRHLWFGDSIKQAVDASRIHHQLLPDEFSYEFGILSQVVQGMEKLGHKVVRNRVRGSIVCAIARLGGVLFANADYRKGGDVLGLN
uniref:Gamma-glutamyltranspeptidase 1 n=1 Tax=Timema bartmani TaxID=61472 RepID=A0A7R9F4X8_9NEOP|nr:unnamed protein product [Timema bartmani]